MTRNLCLTTQQQEEFLDLFSRPLAAIALISRMRRAGWVVVVKRNLGD
jgi:hypothetical protein